jgi:hypothetical protein
MTSFLSYLSSFIVTMAIFGGIILFGWMIGTAIEQILRLTIREEIREHDERQRRRQAELEGKQA